MKTSKNYTKITQSLLISSLAFIFTSVNAADGVEFKLSGQVSRAITSVDNGVDEDVLFVDNNNSGTRFRLTGKMDVRPGLTAGIIWETQYQDNSSGSIDIGDSDNSSTFASRKRDLWFKGGFGKVSLGQGDGAANGTSEVDFSGTTIADYSGQDLYDGVDFVDAAGTVVSSNGGAFNNFDGLSRNDRVRYDTPTFGPVGVAISAGQDKAEVAVRYSQKLRGGSKIGAALGYVGTDDPGKDNLKQLGLSASFIAAGGFNITGAYGEQDFDTGPKSTLDPTNAYVKVGQKFGSSAVSLSYTKTEDQAGANLEAERTNLAYVYNIAKGVELFSDYEKASLDGAQDKDLFAIGSRIKF